MLKHTRLDGFDCHYLADPPVGELLAGLLPDPDKAFENAKIYKPGSRTHAGRVELSGQMYFLKRYNCRGFRYRVFNAFRPSRAWRTWKVTWAFLQAGIPVARPLVFLQERTLRLLGRSYILMDYVEGAGTLAETWSHWTVAQKKQLLCHLADMLGNLHSLGYVHGDLKWTNILVGQKDDELSHQLVDLDGARIGQSPEGRLVQKDLNRFKQDLARYETTSDLGEFFTLEWKRAFENSVSASNPGR